MKKSIVLLLIVLATTQVMASCGFEQTENRKKSENSINDISEPTEPDLKKATTLIYQKKWDQAVKILLELTNDYPESGESWYYLASAYHGKKEYDKAIHSNNMAAKYSDKIRANAYYNLACAYSLTNHKDKALEAIKLAKEHGFINYDLLKNDSDIELLRKAGLIELPKSNTYKKIKARNGIEFKYKVILPENYNKSKAYSALLAYPPGNQGETSTDWFLTEFLGQRANKMELIIVVPVAPDNGWINHPSHHALNDLLKHIQTTYKIDGKFHMFGFESGARPAATFALMSKQYFQSLTTVSSYAWEGWDDEDLASFKVMPVKMIVGANDKHGVNIANHVQSQFEKYKVKSEIEIIPNNGRDLTSLRNSAAISLIDDFIN